MKSLIKITALIVVSIFISSANIYANQTQTISKSQYHDTSVITKKYYSNYVTETKPIEFNFEEEKYIDDITINTKYISSNLLYKKAIAVEFSFEEEEYIDDISL